MTALKWSAMSWAVFIAVDTGRGDIILGKQYTSMDAAKEVNSTTKLHATHAQLLFHRGTAG